jgi:hypothetical protein
MEDAVDLREDSALDALTTLSKVTSRGVEDLNAVQDDLATMEERRRRGWSWRRILASTESHNPLSDVARIVADLGIASGRFRRALARALRGEGMRINEIGSLLEVTRQRVSALVRNRRPD